MNEIKWDENFCRKEYRYFEILYVVGKYVSDFNLLKGSENPYILCSLFSHNKNSEYKYLDKN
jgi:hypothetical protein